MKIMADRRSLKKQFINPGQGGINRFSWFVLIAENK